MFAHRREHALYRIRLIFGNGRSAQIAQQTDIRRRRLGARFARIGKA
jgi:hypothetical protein